jgi:Putative zinc-binding metallo-peptidase
MRKARQRLLRLPRLHVSRPQFMACTAITMALFMALVVATQWERARDRESERAAGAASSAASAWADSSEKGVPSAVPADQGSLVAQMINEKYAVRVVLKDQTYPVTSSYGSIRATNPQTHEVDEYCTVLAQEFLLYPPGLIRRSHLKQIVLCRGLSFEGQLRAAVPDFEHDTLYLDVLAGSYNSVYQTQVIHHEFFHIIDYQDDGEVYSDDGWARLNPRPFEYGNGGAKMQDDQWSGVPSDIPGFLTSYATSGVEEDKAETFAHMVTAYADVSKRATTDAVIRNKISAMKALLAKFCPEMNESFWDRIRWESIGRKRRGKIELRAVSSGVSESEVDPRDRQTGKGRLQRRRARAGSAGHLQAPNRDVTRFFRRAIAAAGHLSRIP